VDGTPNEARKVSEVWETVLQYRDHSERAIFAVTCLGKQNIILRLNWLRKHNPEVNWQTNKVKMSRCPNHCHTCQNETNAERKTAFKEAECICTCCAGSMPSTDVDMEDIPDLAPDSDDDEDNDEPYVGEDVLEDGDRIFVATIPCEAEFIQATSNVSQRLAEAFHKNLQPKSFAESVPTHFHNFEDLFSKLSFDQLPDWKIWDHAQTRTRSESIELQGVPPRPQRTIRNGRIHP
jgi:hypothetical protein